MCVCVCLYVCVLLRVRMPLSYIVLVLAYVPSWLSVGIGIYIRFASIAISSNAIITKLIFINSVNVSSYPPWPWGTPCPLPGAVCRSLFNDMCTVSCPDTYSTLAYASSLSDGGRSVVGPLFGLRPGSCPNPTVGVTLIAEAFLRDLWTRPSGLSCSVKHTYSMSSEQPL